MKIKSIFEWFTKRGNNCTRELGVNCADHRTVNDLLKEIHNYVEHEF